MLTLHQANEYNRHKTLSDFFSMQANTVLINSFLPFKNQVTDFTANVTLFESLIPNKDITTNGITSGKVSLKRKVADNMAIYCCKTRAFALLNNHPDLAEAMNFKSTSIFHLKDSDFLPFIQHTISLINPFIADPAFVPYGVTVANLTAVTTDATTFKNSIGIADATSSTANVANKDINIVLKKLEGNLEHFDLLINHFQTINADFVKAYHITSSLSAIGVHHTGIEGTICDAGNKPLPGATIKILGTDKETQTDLRGYFTIIKVKSGDKQIEISAPGYITTTELHYFTRGHIDPLNFQLHK